MWDRWGEGREMATGIPVGDASFEKGYAMRRTERALSKTNKIVDKLCPQELQIAQVLVHFCALPLVDYLAGSLPAHIVREALQNFDEGLLQAISPRIVPPEIYEDPLLMRRLRLPARMAGGAVRERGAWLADAAYSATMLRILPEMVDHVLPGTSEEIEVGFLHDHFADILGAEADNQEGTYQHLCEGNTELGTDFVTAWEALREAAGHPTDPVDVLSDPPMRAGLHLKTGAEVSEFEPEEGEEDKVKEQKQLTMSVEAVLERKLRSDVAALEVTDMRRAAFFSVDASSRHWIFTPPYKGCELTSDEMRVIIDRFYGVPCRMCKPHVGRQVRGETAGPRNVVLDAYGVTLANANVGGDRWRRRHDAVLSVIMSELAAADQHVRDNVFGLVAGHFGDGSAEARRKVLHWANQLCGTGDRRRRNRQGVVPDLLIESAVDAMLQVVGKRTLFELKQINFVAAYKQKAVAQPGEGHAVKVRADRVNTEYRRKLHEVDKIAGWRCPGPKLADGKCSYRDAGQAAHPPGGGEKFFFEKFGEVEPLVFGHFGELNARFHMLIEKTAVAVARLHHREHGWKNARAGIPRAKAGVMRRISMAVLKTTARHVLHGLEMIVPQAMHTHAERRMRSAAAREADFDEHRAEVRSFGCGGHDHREYDYRG